MVDLKRLGLFVVRGPGCFVAGTNRTRMGRVVASLSESWVDVGWVGCRSGCGITLLTLVERVVWVCRGGRGAGEGW